jgi:tetratricopeptide (TPR) repeat protein
MSLDDDDIVVVGNGVAEPADPSHVAAAEVLERAVQSGFQDSNVLYLLALAYKRQNKLVEARAALRKIMKPDANVMLQMGLISLCEQNLAQAEGEFQRGRDMDKSSYEIAYNLLMTQLSQAKVNDALIDLPRLVELVTPEPGRPAAPVQNAAERRFLVTLQSLLRQAIRGEDVICTENLLLEMAPDVEERIVKVVKTLGNIDVVHKLLRALSNARMTSVPVREAYYESALVKAKDLMDHCAFTEAILLLRPLASEKRTNRQNQAALLNLLGCCACLTQDMESGITHFNAALKLANNDPRIFQNLALAHELNGELPEADPHWNRYFDLLDDRVPTPADLPNYSSLLAYEGLNRLAGKYCEKEKWSSAVGYVQRACALRPNDPDTLERLFHLFANAKRYKDARRTLDQLRSLRPNDPQLDLYELDLVEPKSLNDIERRLSEIDRIMKRYPNEPRVEERAINMVGQVIPVLGSICDKLTDEMSRVIDQVRHLPNYQINWSAVREVMRDLLKEFQKLRRIAGRCLPLVHTDEQRRIVRDLADHIDKKMDACRSMMG